MKVFEKGACLEDTLSLSPIWPPSPKFLTLCRHFQGLDSISVEAGGMEVRVVASNYSLPTFELVN